jgi:hypothetical protein
MEIAVTMDNSGHGDPVTYHLLERSTAEHVAAMSPLQRRILAAYLNWLLEEIELAPR